MACMSDSGLVKRNGCLLGCWAATTVTALVDTGLGIMKG